MHFRPIRIRAPEEELRAQTLSEALARQPRVLLGIVDPDLRDLCREALLRARYTVLETESRLLAAELARTAAPHLLVLEIQTTGLSGHGLAQQLREEASTARIPVVALTLGNSAAPGFGPDPLTRLLPVPFRAEELLEAAADAIQKEASMGKTRSRREPVPTQSDPTHRCVDILLGIAESAHVSGRHAHEFGAEQLSDCPHDLCRMACRHAMRHGFPLEERELSNVD